MYEKKKIDEMQRALGSNNESEKSCGICDREKTVVVCAECLLHVDNTRVNRKCENHPRAIFLMDMKACPRCRSRDLRELGVDDPPNAMEMAPSEPLAPMSPPLATMGFAPLAQSRAPAPPLFRHTQASVLTARVGSGPVLQTVNRNEPAMANSPAKATPLRRRIVVPQQSPQSPGIPSPTQAPPPPAPLRNIVMGGAAPPPIGIPAPPANVPGNCICERNVEFIMCTKCGSLVNGVLKYRPCPRHPESTNGMKFCPECGAGSENLDEY